MRVPFIFQQQQVKKDCRELENDLSEPQFDVFECGENLDPHPLAINDGYGIPIDQIVSKAKFELDVGNIDISSKISVGGRMAVFGNVAGFYEAEMNMDVAMTGDLVVSLGHDGGIMGVSEVPMAAHSAHLPIPSTVVEAKSPAMQTHPHPPSIPTLEILFEELLGPEQSPILDTPGSISPVPRSEEKPNDFFHAFSTFEGEFNASLSSPSTLYFPGKFLNPPLVLDFSMKPPHHIPEIDIDFYFPGIGDVTKMSAVHIVKAFLLFKDFLIGSERNDSVEKCSGGLLGAEISGQPVFGYQLPGKTHPWCFMKRLNPLLTPKHHFCFSF